MTTYRDVVDFLAGECGVAPEAITPHSRLRQDLGVNADNADGIIKDFGYAFRADVSSFRIGDYFSAMPRRNMAMSVLLWLSGNGKILKTLTVADLVRAAERGRL